jgi:hypothetical protein
MARKFEDKGHCYRMLTGALAAEAVAAAFLGELLFPNLRISVIRKYATSSYKHFASSNVNPYAISLANRTTCNCVKSSPP